MTQPTKSDRDRTARMIPIVQALAARIARRLPSHVDVDDLIGAGHVGLAEALRACRDHEDRSFKAYAINRIRGEMMDELRRMDRLSRHQRDRVKRVQRAEETLRAQSARSIPPAALAERAGLSLEHVEEARSLAAAGVQTSLDSLPGGDTIRALGVVERIDDALDQRRVWSRVQKAIDALPPRLRRVLSLQNEGCTLKDIGGALGVTEARACQLRREAVEFVRARTDTPAPIAA